MSASLRMISTLTFAALAAALLVACGGGGSDDASGNDVAFCRVTSNYDAGFGVPGIDTITIRSIKGPGGATVTNAANGEYVVTGSYKLGSFDTATISLAWGGTTNYSDRQDFVIPAKGTGEFTVRVSKTGGGEGSLFLRMNSDWRWMFDAVPVNTQCS